MFRTITPILLLALATSPARAADPDFSPIGDVAKEEIAAAGIPGAVVVIVHGDRMVYSQGFGVVSAEGADPVTPLHLFRLGSTTKVFVGMCLVRLAEAGKLKLNEQVGQLVPGLPPGISRATLHQLLTHTAGLADDAVMHGRHDDDALGAGIREWQSDRQFTTPGEVFSYSNPGYWLAGYAAERAAGKPFADVMAEQVFTPLGMARTTFRPTRAMTYPLAQGHDRRVNQLLVIRPAADNVANWPAGSMFSNGIDLVRLLVGLLNDGKIADNLEFSASTLKAVSTPHVALPNGRNHYGYGLTVEDRGGIAVYSHGGSRAGYGSFLMVCPKRRFGMAVLANRTGASLPKTVAKAAGLAGVPAPEKPKDAPKSDDPKRIAGVYRNGTQSIVLTWADDKLWRVVGESRGTVEAIGGTRFRTATGAVFDVVTGRDGTTEYVFEGLRAYRKQAK